MTQPWDSSSRTAVNLPELLIQVDNDRDLVRELITIFKKKYPPLLMHLQESVAGGDTRGVETTSHALTGMLSCLSATRAAALAGQLEQLGRERKASELAEALALFEQEAAKLLPELDGYTAEVGL